MWHTKRRRHSGTSISAIEQAMVKVLQVVAPGAAFGVAAVAGTGCRVVIIGKVAGHGACSVSPAVVERRSSSRRSLRSDSRP